MVATALAAPADFKTYQDRKQMNEDNQAIEDYKRNCEFHRLLRRYCGPNAYSVFTALVDRANDAEYDGWAFPSYEKIMADTGIGNRNAITTALEILFDLGLIEWQLNGRQAIYRPAKRVNSTELILFKERAQSYQNNTKDSIKTVRSIVSKRYSNVNQDNVNQDNELTTPKGVGEPPPAQSPDFQVVEIIEPILKPSSRQAEVQSTYPATSPPPIRKKVKGSSVAGEVKDSEPKDKAKEKPPLHPALKIYQDTFKLLPEKRQYQAIIDAVGDTPDVLCEWGKACYKWNLKPWKPGNISGLINFFEEGNYKNDHQQQQRGPYLGGNGGQQQLEQRPAYSSHPGRAIKPRGSDPGGRLTEAELLEGYQS